MPFIDLDELPEKEPLPGWKGRYAHSDQMTFAFYQVEEGASIHVHDHEQEEVWHVLEGRLEVTIGGESRVVGPGGVAIVPPHTAHGVRALAASRAVVVDHPRRESVGRVDTR